MKKIRSKVGLEDNPYRVLATFLTSILCTVALAPVITVFIWIPLLSLTSLLPTASVQTNASTVGTQLTTWTLYLTVAALFLFLFSKIRKVSLKKLGLLNAVSLVWLTFFVLFFM